MKKLLLAILIMVSLLSNGQAYLTAPLKFTSGTRITTAEAGAVEYDGKDLFFTPTGTIRKVISRYDTTILYKGREGCDHLFASKQIYEGMYSSPSYGCLVWHDETGCPDKWSNEKKICIICLKHIQIKETRTLVALQDEYELAVERLNKLINK